MMVSREVSLLSEKYHIMKAEYYGNGTFKPIDSRFVTYEGPLYTEEELLEMNNIWRIKGYYSKREFYKPEETDMLLPVPDARNVLMWKPDIITDENGCAEVEFFCSDINTGFVGVIEGTDGTGSLGTSQCEFRVMKH